MDMKKEICSLLTFSDEAVIEEQRIGRKICKNLIFADRSWILMGLQK